MAEYNGTERRGWNSNVQSLAATVADQGQKLAGVEYQLALLVETVRSLERFITQDSATARSQRAAITAELQRFVERLDLLADEKLNAASLFAGAMDAFHDLRAAIDPDGERERNHPHPPQLPPAEPVEQSGD